MYFRIVIPVFAITADHCAITTDDQGYQPTTEFSITKIILSESDTVKVIAFSLHCNLIELKLCLCSFQISVTLNVIELRSGGERMVSINK